MSDLPKWGDIPQSPILAHDDMVVSVPVTISTKCDLTLYRVSFPIEYHDLIMEIVDEINAENEAKRLKDLE